MPKSFTIHDLPKEERPRTDGMPYAMDTRGELGEWRGRLMHNPGLRVFIGADPDFPGLSQISRNFDAALKTSFPIAATMEELAARACLGKSS